MRAAAHSLKHGQPLPPQAVQPTAWLSLLKQPQLHKGKPMFDIEHYKKPTNWANVALWFVSVAAIVVVILDVLYWRP
jgi:hypothetical protein